MSQELYYTSVPKGLQPGRRGFCTVAVTRGIADTYAQRIEGLSVYVPLFQPHDPNAGKNPVAFCHWRISLGGKASSVLSRVCFSGLDYSQRANKFAHHIILNPEEQASGGPAWVMSQPGMMESAWEGEPRLINRGRKIPQGDSEAGIAERWQTVTGDAGWAGVLAESFINNPEKPTFIVFKPGMDILPLIGEALRLIPRDKRWDVTFSTYFTSLPQGTTCAWRCCIKDSESLREAKRRPGTLVIDLTKSLPRAEGGELVEAARTGKMPKPAGKPEPVIAATPVAKRKIADDSPTPLKLMLVSEREDTAVLAKEPAAVAVAANDTEEDMIPAAKFKMFLAFTVIYPLVLAGVLFAAIMVVLGGSEGTPKQPQAPKEDTPEQPQAPKEGTPNQSQATEEVKDQSQELAFATQLTELVTKIGEMTEQFTNHIEKVSTSLASREQFEKITGDIDHFRGEINELREWVARLEFQQMRVNVLDENRKFLENMDIKFPNEKYEPDKINFQLKEKEKDISVESLKEGKEILLKAKFGDLPEEVIKIELTKDGIKFHLEYTHINNNDKDKIREKFIKALRQPLVLTDSNGKKVEIYLIPSK